MKLLPLTWMIIAVTKSFFMNAPLNLGEQAILPPIRTNATHAVYFYDGIFRYERLHSNVEQPATKAIIGQSIRQLITTSSPENHNTVSTFNLTSEINEDMDDKTATMSSFNKEDISTEKQFSLENGPTQFSNDQIIRSEEVTLLLTPPIEREILKREETTKAVIESNNIDPTIIKTERTFMQQDESTTQMTIEQSLMSERNFLSFSKGDNNISVMSTRSNDEAVESSTHIDGIVSRENTESSAVNSGVVTWMRTTVFADHMTVATDSITADVLVSANNKTNETVTSTYGTTTASDRSLAEAAMFVGNAATEVATFTDKPMIEGLSTDVSPPNGCAEILSADYTTTENESSSAETTMSTGNMITETATLTDKTTTGTATEATLSAANKRTETMHMKTVGNEEASREATGSGDSQRTGTVAANNGMTGNEGAHAKGAVQVGNEVMENATFADRSPTHTAATQATASAKDKTTTGGRTSAEATSLVSNNVATQTALSIDRRPGERISTEDTTSVDKRTIAIEHTLKDSMKLAHNQTAGTEENDATFDPEISNPTTSMRNMETATQPITIYSHYVVTELNKGSPLRNHAATTEWYDRFSDNNTSKDVEREPQTWRHSNP
uniref:Cap-specific mRNA (nucleoside-2'-O-)-methyltransferase 2 n=1 Tax=Parascaris univalens TaxID=6257 RepID=A0A915A821_PARUN